MLTDAWSLKPFLTLSSVIMSMTLGSSLTKSLTFQRTLINLPVVATRDVNKDLTSKDQDKDKDLTPKDQDKDKDLLDLTPKDKDLTPKDQDKDKDLKYVLK